MIELDVLGKIELYLEFVGIGVGLRRALEFGNHLGSVLEVSIGINYFLFLLSLLLEFFFLLSVLLGLLFS